MSIFLPPMWKNESMGKKNAVKWFEIYNGKWYPQTTDLTILIIPFRKALTGSGCLQCFTVIIKGFILINNDYLNFFKTEF